MSELGFTAAEQDKFDFTVDELTKGLADPMWRLNNLYKIVDKRKQVVTLRFNQAQKKLFNNLHTRNIILKARKMGFSTAIQIFMLDSAMFSPNEKCVVIAQSRDIAESIFRDVILFAYNNLPEVFRNAVTVDDKDPTKKDIQFRNGSVIEVRTGSRGTTPTILHVTEFGKISTEDPAKAKEIVNGAITSVAEDGLVFVESTGEQGDEAEFYKMVQVAVKLRDSGKKPWKLQFKFHFYPWMEDPAYVAPPSVAIVTPRDHAYFDDIEKKTKTIITPEQRAWYVLTRDNTYSGDTNSMYQEMPSTWEEPFKIALDGSYWADQLSALRKNDRITTVPHDPYYPVCTFWDLGADDFTAIWCIQAKPSQFAVINYVEDNGEALQYYVQELEKFGYVWLTHYLPHDSTHVKQGQMRNLSALEMLQELRPTWDIRPVERTPDKTVAIQQTRAILPLCVFDETNCKVGLQRLEMYRKAWNRVTGTWRKTPVDDISTHGADAFMQAGQARALGMFGFTGSIYMANADNGFVPDSNMGY